MENVSHSLTGAVLSRAGLDRLTPLALPTLLIASNLPDADVVVSRWGELAYLVYHRGITHSYLGIAVQALLLACTMYGIGRLVARFRPDTPTPRFWGLIVVSLVGLGGHLLLDYSNSYGVRPLQPFDDAWSYGDLVFIVDAWMWLILGGALLLGTRRSVGPTVGYLALFGLFTLGVVYGSSSGAVAGGPVLWVWVCGIVALTALRFRVDPRHARRLAGTALLVLVGYWGLLWVFNVGAIARVSEGEVPEMRAPEVQYSALPTLFYPNRWRVMAETADSIVEYEVDVLSGAIAQRGRFDRNLASQEARSALESCAGRVARWFNRYLVVDVETNGDGTTTVNLRDIRFPQSGRRGIGVTPVVLGPSMEPVEDDRTCPE
jgi:membrane-bound metal-dependent hydrolase YbcI (DUF457 family)